jgi:hypothetical protein
MTVYLPLNLLSSRSFVHKPEDFPVCPERVGRLNAYKPLPTLSLMLIQYPFKEGLKGTARDGLHYLGRILLYILAIPVKSVRLANSIAEDSRQKENKIPTNGNFPQPYLGGGGCHRYSPHLHPRIRLSYSLSQGSILAGRHSPL